LAPCCDLPGFLQAEQCLTPCLARHGNRGLMLGFDAQKVIPELRFLGNQLWQGGVHAGVFTA